MVDGLPPNLVFFPVAALATLTAALVTLIFAVHAWRKSGSEKSSPDHHGSESENSSIEEHSSGKQPNAEVNGNTIFDSDILIGGESNSEKVLSNGTYPRKRNSVKNDEVRGIQSDGHSQLDQNSEVASEISLKKADSEISSNFICSDLGKPKFEEQMGLEGTKEEENSIKGHISGKEDEKQQETHNLDAISNSPISKNRTDDFEKQSKSSSSSFSSSTPQNEESDEERGVSRSRLKVASTPPKSIKLSPSHILCTCSKYQNESTSTHDKVKDVENNGWITRVGDIESQISDDTLVGDNVNVLLSFKSRLQVESNKIEITQIQTISSVENKCVDQVPLSSGNLADDTESKTEIQVHNPLREEPDVICFDKSHLISEFQADTNRSQPVNVNVSSMPDVLNSIRAPAMMSVSDALFFQYDTRAEDSEKKRLMADDQLDYTNRNSREMLTKLCAKFGDYPVENYEESNESSQVDITTSESISFRLGENVLLPPQEESDTGDDYLLSDVEPEIRTSSEAYATLQCQIERALLESRRISSSHEGMHKSGSSSGKTGKTLEESTEKPSLLTAASTKPNNGVYSCLPSVDVTSGGVASWGVQGSCREGFPCDILGEMEEGAQEHHGNHSKLLIESVPSLTSPACNAVKSTTPTRLQMAYDSYSSCELHDADYPGSDRFGRLDQLVADLRHLAEDSCCDECGVFLPREDTTNTNLSDNTSDSKKDSGYFSVVQPLSTEVKDFSWPSSASPKVARSDQSSDDDPFKGHLVVVGDSGNNLEDLRSLGKDSINGGKSSSIPKTTREVSQLSSVRNSPYQGNSRCAKESRSVQSYDKVKPFNSIPSQSSCSDVVQIVDNESKCPEDSKNNQFCDDPLVLENMEESPTRKRLLRLLERDQERKSRSINSVLNAVQGGEFPKGQHIKDSEKPDNKSNNNTTNTLQALESAIGHMQQLINKEEIFRHDANNVIEIAEALKQSPSSLTTTGEIHLDCTNEETGNNLHSTAKYLERDNQSVFSSDSNQEEANATATIIANIRRGLENGGKSHEISTGIALRLSENHDSDQQLSSDSELGNNSTDISSSSYYSSTIKGCTDSFTTSVRTKVRENEMTVTTEVVDRWRPQSTISAMRDTTVARKNVEKPKHQPRPQKHSTPLENRNTRVGDDSTCFTFDENTEIDRKTCKKKCIGEESSLGRSAAERRCLSTWSSDSTASEGGRVTKKQLRFSDELYRDGTGGPAMEEVTSPSKQHETANAATNTTTPTKIKNLRFKLDPDVYDLPSENGYYYDDDDYNRRPGWRKQPRYNTFSALDLGRGREPVKVVSVRTSVVPAGHKMVVKPVCVSEGHRSSEDGVVDSKITVKHLDIDLRIRLETEDKNGQVFEAEDWKASPNKKAHFSSSPSQSKRSPAPDYHGWNQSLSPVSETCDWMTTSQEGMNASFGSEEQESIRSETSEMWEKHSDSGGSDGYGNAQKELNSSVESDKPSPFRFEEVSKPAGPSTSTPPRPSTLPLNHYRKHLQLPRKKFVPDPEAVERITGFKSAEERSKSKPPLPIKPLSIHRYNTGAKGKIDQLRKRYLDTKSMLNAQKVDSSAKFEQFLNSAQRDRANLVTSSPDLAAFEAAVKSQWYKAKQGSVKNLLKENTPPPNTSEHNYSELTTRSRTPDDVWLGYVQRLRSQLNRRSQSMTYLETDVDAFAEDKSRSMLALEHSPPESTQSLVIQSSKNMNHINVSLEESGRTKSEHELRVEKSLRGLSVPDWYKNSSRPKSGFLLDKRSQEKKGWAAVKSLASSTSSLASTGRTRTTARSLRTSQENLIWSRGSASPASADNSYNRWGRTNSGPSLSLALARAFREPYMGWRAQTPSSCASPSPQVDFSPPSWAVMDNTDCSTPLTSDLQAMDEEEDTGISFDGEDVLEDAESSKDGAPQKIDFSPPPSADDTCEDVINISMDTCDVNGDRQESKSHDMHGEDTCDDIKNISMDTFELCPPEAKEDHQASPAGDSTCDDVLNISTDTSSHIALNGNVGTSSVVGGLENTTDDIDNISTDTSNVVVHQAIVNGSSHGVTSLSNGHSCLVVSQPISNGDTDVDDSMLVKSMPNLSEKRDTKDRYKLDPKKKRYSYNKSIYQNEFECAKQKTSRGHDGEEPSGRDNNKVIWIESSFVGSRTTTSIVVLPITDPILDASSKGSIGSNSSVGRPASR